MGIRKTIVSYESIHEAIRKNVARAYEETSKLEIFDPGAMVGALTNALKKLEEKEISPHVFSCPNDEVGSLLQSFLAERANSEGKVEQQPSGMLEAKFDDHDFLGWIGSFFTWWRGIKKHSWLTAPEDPESFPNTTRLALLGDWGTGMYGAPVSAHTIESDAKGYSLIVHLGDVYYSGMENEVKERFLAIWPRNGGAISKAVNANHEMYTGGHGYFSLILPTFKQPASYFALQNDYWTLLGLDSAYKNPFKGSLTDDQISWLGSLVNKANGRKVILFSHHQAYTRLDSTLDNELIQEIYEFLAAKKIFAWYWGHEHRCVIYDPHPAWGLHGRCIGHSGYPYFRDELQDVPIDVSLPQASWRRLEPKNLVPGCIVLNDPNPYVLDEDPAKYGAQGHMTLEFNGEHLNEIIHLPDGKVIYERTLI